MSKRFFLVQSVNVKETQNKGKLKVEQLCDQWSFESMVYMLMPFPTFSSRFYVSMCVLQSFIYSCCLLDIGAMHVLSGIELLAYVERGVRNNTRIAFCILSSYC